MQQEQTIRQTKRFIVLGTNGTGKTTLLHKIVNNAGQRVIIITPYDNEWDDVDANGNPRYPINELRTLDDYRWTGICRHIFDPDRTLKAIQHLTRCFIVFDDCRYYLDAKTDKILHHMLISSRQAMLDMSFVAHGFSEVPPKAFTFCTEYFLFRTEDNVQRRSGVVRNLPLVERMQQEVNRAAVRNPHYFKRFTI